MKKQCGALIMALVILNLSISAQDLKFETDEHSVVTHCLGKSFTQLTGEFQSSKVPVYDKTFRSLIIESNIRQGDLKVAASEQKINSVREIVRPVLKLYGRETVEIIIFNSSAPNAVCIGGTAIFYSTGMLKLASDEELKSITAHELAHEYFNSVALAAREARDYKTLRYVELMCDAFAVAALRDLRVDPMNFKAILTKLTENRLAVAWKGDGSDTHPRLSVRLEAIDKLSISRN